jgi:hypothetical protein
VLGIDAGTSTGAPAWEGHGGDRGCAGPFREVEGVTPLVPPRQAQFN